MDFNTNIKDLLIKIKNFMGKVIFYIIIGRLKEIKGTYEGSFSHGEKDGKGKYFYTHGYRYEG